MKERTRPRHAYAPVDDWWVDHGYRSEGEAIRARRSVDWTILDEPEVEKMVRSVAWRVWLMYRPNRQLGVLYWREDLEQEARIILATAHEEFRAYLDQGRRGHAHKALRDRLANVIRTHRRHARRHTSLDRLKDKGREPANGRFVGRPGRQAAHDLYHGLDGPGGEWFDDV